MKRRHRIPPLVHRRKVKAPTGIALSYAAVLRTWLARVQAMILEQVLEDWARNPVHFSGAVPRQDSDFIHEKLGAVKIALETTLDPAKLAPEIAKFGQRVSNRGKDEFRTVIKISTHDIGVKTTLDQFRDRNVDLIKTLAGKQLDDIRTLLERAEIQAMRVEDLRAEIEQSFGVSKSRADLMARDQVLKLNGQLTQTRQQNAGISQYIWTTSNDERVRPMHAELEGTIQSWAAPPEISEDGRTGHPGDDFQCRCTAFPILEELGEAGLDQALGGFSSTLAARPES